MRIFKALKRSLAILILLSSSLSAQVNQHLQGNEEDYESALELLEKQQYGNAQLIFDRIADNPSYGEEKRI